MDALKKISDQLHKLAVELDNEISKSKNLDIVVEGDTVPTEPTSLNPFPDEQVQENKVGEDFTIPDGNPNIVDEISDRADEMGVESAEVICPQCLSDSWLKDNRLTRQSAVDELNGDTSHLDSDGLTRLEKKSNIPMFSCQKPNQYNPDSNGCGWATWNLQDNPPLGSDRWMTQTLDGEPLEVS